MVKGSKECGPRISSTGLNATKCFARNRFGENSMVLYSFVSKSYVTACDRQTDRQAAYIAKSCKCIANARHIHWDTQR